MFLMVYYPSYIAVCNMSAGRYTIFSLYAVAGKLTDASQTIVLKYRNSSHKGLP